MTRSESLWLPGHFLDQPPAVVGTLTSIRRRYVWQGALAGLLSGSVARVWMRTLSEDPVFSVVGTTLILLVFAGLGAAAGLALAWRRLRSPRRMFVQRGVGLAPFLLMGPFMLFFLPSVVAATLFGHRGWRRLLRTSLWVGMGLFTAFIFLAMVSNGARGFAQFALYVPLAYLMFVTNRIALEPRAATPPPPLASAEADPYEPWMT